MEYMVVWLLQSVCSLTILFAGLGIVYVFTKSNGATRSSAWDSWRKRSDSLAVKRSVVASMVPPAIMLIVAFSTAGFLYGFFDKSVAQVRITNMSPHNALRRVLQSVVFEPSE